MAPTFVELARSEGHGTLLEHRVIEIEHNQSLAYAVNQNIAIQSLDLDGVKEFESIHGSMVAV